MKSCTLFTRTCGLKPCRSLKVLGFLCLLFFLFVPQLSCDPYPTVSSKPRQLTEQERWIIGQIRQGKEADLITRGDGKEENYSLDAGFLKYLFIDSDLKVCNEGISIVNATIEGDLNLDNLEINYPVGLNRCIFKGQVNLKRSHFKKDLSFEGSKFLKSANFTGIIIDGYCLFNDAQFEAESLWNNAKIGAEFQAQRAEFRSSEATVDFNSIKVADSIHFENAQFYGPVIFIRASTGRQFIAHESKYLNPEKLVNFRSTTTANILFLIKAEFHGPVEFKLAEIGMNFNASGVKFLNKKQPKDFSHMKVGQQVLLNDAVLQGDFDFSYGDLYDLDIRGSQQAGKDGSEPTVSIPFLNLKGAQVQRNLTLANASIDKLNASQMKVKGLALLENVQINKSADFRSGSFQALDFEKVRWPEVSQPQPQDDPKNPGKGGGKHFRFEVYLGDITFGSLSIDKPECDANANPCDSDYKEADFKKILDFVNECPFYTQSYVQVETLFKHIGRDSWANAVFMRMNDRELAEKRAWYDPLRWLEWFFWGKIAGYGRAPFRVFFLALAFIILGACLFDPAYLIENKRPPKGNIYRSVVIRFLISLDRFLPIELGLAKYWESRDGNFVTWFYFYLQQIIGWILIPIALASIYSQIK